MREPPETRYAKSDDVHIAYRVFGEGATDLVVVPMVVSHLEAQWEDPDYRSFFERLGDFCRVIQFDKRGMGLSDGVGEVPPTLEERMDDIRAVMDAAGCERAVLFGISEGGGLSLLFAATYPERVTAIALFGATARILQAPDYPVGVAPEVLEAGLEATVESWGDGVATNLFAPSLAYDAEARRRWGRIERAAASPGAFRQTMHMNARFDVRDVLASVRAPVVVMYRRDEILPGAAASRYLGERLPDARGVELEGIDHVPWVGDTEPIVQELRTLVAGETAPPVSLDRVLATVLFTDIVDSTRLASELGDRRWRRLLDDHDQLVAEQVTAHRGTVVKGTGDGLLATFDGPGRALACAGVIRQRMRPLGLLIRAGLHTGEVELRGEDVGGIAVHIAARVAALAGADEILVSRTVRDLVVGSEARFEDRGRYELKGVPEPWEVLAVASA